MSERVYIPIIVLCVLACAIFFRFINLFDQGFISWDEGMYMNEAVFYASTVKAVPDIIATVKAEREKDKGIKEESESPAASEDGEDEAPQETLSSQLAAIASTIEGWPPSSAKPMQGFLIYLLSLIVGMGDSTGQILSALFGVLSICILFFFVWQIYDIRTAFLAAFFLSFSGYHIYISRLGVPETTSHFFILLAWYLYWRSTEVERYKKFLIFAGFSMGMAFTLNYRWIIILPIPWLIEFIYFISYRNWERFHSRALTMFLPFILIPVFCDLPYWPVRIMPDLGFSFRHMPEKIYGYFDQLIYYLGFQSGKGTLHIHTLYLKLLFHLNGFLVGLLTLFGIVTLIRWRRLQDILILLTVAVPFILLSIKQRGNSLRYISIILPFLSVLAAVALDYIYSTIFNKGGALILGVVAFIAALFSVLPAVPFMSMHSGYREARNYLESNGGTHCLATSNPFFEFYFGRNVAEQTPKKKEDFVNALKNGKYTFVVFDFMTRRVLKKETKDFVEQHCQPVARIENKIGTNKYTLIESLGWRHFKKDYINNALKDPHSKYIDIYRAEDVLNAYES